MLDIILLILAVIVTFAIIIWIGLFILFAIGVFITDLFKRI